MSVLKLGWMSTSSNLLFSPLWSSCLPSLMPSSNNLPNNSELECEQDHECSQNIEIMWIVSFSSGQCIVLVLVTRFFASVLMWRFTTSPDMSIHNPRRNWHEPKHFRKEYSPTTIVESTVFSIFWLSWSIRLPYDIPSFLTRFCWKHCHASLWRSIFIVSVGSIR